MAEKKITKQLQTAIADISSGDQLKIEKGLKVISLKGHTGLIKNLVDLLLKSKDQDLQKNIGLLFANIQDEGSIPVIMSFLNDETYKEVHSDIINSIWNSKLDYSGYIADMVFLAIEGDFMKSVECLTVIENMQGPFEEHDLLEAQLYLKEYHSNRINESDQKNEIISDIATFIKDQNEGVDADLLLE